MYRLLLMDIDGVLCSTKTYNKDHEVISKNFNDKDFTAIKRFKACNIECIFITGDSWNKAMCEKRNTQCIVTSPINGKIQKELVVEKLLSDRNLNKSEVIYIGDDYYDIAAAKLCTSFCPKDACMDLKKISTVLTTKGGEGCIAELFETLVLPDNYPLDNL